MRKPRLPIRPPIFACVLFATSLLLFLASVQSFGILHDARSNTSAFELFGRGMSYDAAKDAERAALEQDGPGSIAIWSQDDGHAAANPQVGTSTEITVVSYVGDIGLLLPNLAMHPTEPGTCALSSDACEKLFGQPDATGSSVLVDGVSLQVVETVPHDAALMVQVGESGAVFTRLTTRALDADGFPVTEGLVASTLGVSAKALDYRGLELLAHACLFAYPLALVVALVPLCRRETDRAGSRPIGHLACLLTAAAGALGATFAFTCTLPAFGNYYPTVWSDFPAWQEAWRTWTEGLASLALSRQTVLDEPAVMAALATVLLGLAAFAALVATMLQVRVHAAPSQAKHA